MPAVGNAEDTPLSRQYKSLKSAYPHAVLFFRLGDFYEMFGDDARLAAPLLGLVLTHRQGQPMCGVPHHAAPHHIAKLLKAGHRIAIADQMEDPAAAKGIVKRAVTRLITPGTVVEDELLGGAATNYLVALELDLVGWGLACLEASTGEFWATQAINDTGLMQLRSLLAKLDPAEILAAAPAVERLVLERAAPARAALTRWQVPAFSEAVPAGWSEPELWKNRHLALRAALRARQYVSETRFQIKDIPPPSYKEAVDSMQLDESAIRTLELVASSEGGKAGSLWGVLDRSRTPMGSRRLRQWLLHPRLDLGEIERRQLCVGELVENAEARGELRALVERACDLERVIHRMATRSASPRDLAALRESAALAVPVGGWLARLGPDSGLAPAARDLSEISGRLTALYELLARALADAPPAKLADGGLIRAGWHAELDSLRSLKADSRRYLSELERKERADSSIPSLKVGYNSVFGYYIEVTKVHSAKVPARYSRKQTLVNAERYITPELKELEARILGAEEKYLRLEAELFEELRARVLAEDSSVRRFAALLSELDAFAALAEAASASGWVRPTVDLSHDFVVEDGRHPVVEAALPAGTFVPNSIALDGLDPQTIVLTGPNMGGKSVFLRQNALIAVMAQSGSFVPARSARIGLVDKVLTRIGAQDQLARGESTFMVEMRETSHILKSATPRSLVLLDEVGRGTSTYDGISIAWAVLEHLNKARPRAPRVVFATHYFELTRLASLLPGVVNASVEAREWTNAEGKTEVVFLHKISPGPADRSFGIHVAELAGLPPSCLERAREILKVLESGAGAPGTAASSAAELPLFSEHPVVSELKSADLDKMTPLDALARLSAWKKRL